MREALKGQLDQAKQAAVQQALQEAHAERHADPHAVARQRVTERYNRSSTPL